MCSGRKAAAIIDSQKLLNPIPIGCHFIMPNLEECLAVTAIPNGCEREYSSSKLGDKVYEIACSRGVRTQKAIRNRGSGRRRAESWRSPAGDHGDRHLPH